MKQVTISSTVLNSHITLNFDHLNEVKKLELQLVDQNVPFWSISGKDLDALASELESIIDNSLIIPPISEKQNIDVEYKGISYKLDFRNDYHFYIAALVDVYDMIAITNSHKSHLYIFNKDLLKTDYGESIIAYLRVHNWLTNDQLYEGISKLLKNSENTPILDKEIMQRGLQHLMSYGLIYQDKRNSEYSVTATGYMYW